MMYKATLTFSLLFFAVGGFAQNDGGADTSSSVQPPSNISSPTGSQVYPSGIPIPTTPTTDDDDSSQTNRTRPSGCYPHHNHSAISTDLPLSSGVFSSVAYSASTGVSMPQFSCVSNSEYTAIPTETALPSGSESGSRPIYTMTPTGSYDGNLTFPTGSSVPFPSSSGQQDPPANTPTATASFVGRRMLVRRQY